MRNVWLKNLGLMLEWIAIISDQLMLKPSCLEKNAIENHYDRDVFCGINELKKSVKDDEKEDL